MNVYGELDPMIEHRTQFAFKVKRQHKVKVNMPNIAYPNQYIDIEIPHGSRDHVIVYCFILKQHLKPVVILLATCLALKMQWPT